MISVNAPTTNESLASAPVAIAPLEPTLGAALRKLAYNELPSRFHLALQLSIPFGIQAWVWGWRRSAGWMLVLSAFGAWALCEQMLDRIASDSDYAAKRGRVWRTVIRVGRGVTAFVAIMTIMLLMVDAIGMLMGGTVSRCLGCAG